MANHYATLGVGPASSQAAIRAAYLRLVRFYHPDRNPSAAAEEKVRQVNAAYAVLGDPDRRARYDAQRTIVRADDPQFHWRGDKGLFVASWFGVAVVGAMFLLFSPVLIPIVPGRVTQGIEKADGRGTIAPARFTVASDTLAIGSRAPEEIAQRQNHRNSQSVAAQKPAGTRDLLVALAAPLRMASEISREFSTPFVRSSGNSPSSRARPKVTPHVVTPPTISDPRSDMINLERRDGVADVDHQRSSEYPRLTMVSAEKPAIPPLSERVTKPKTQPRVAVTSPSFSCASARTWAAASVCKNARFANMDRQLAKLWGDAMARAGDSERAKLIESDRKFLSGRDACSSDACVDAAYSAQIRRVTEGSASR